MKNTSTGDESSVLTLNNWKKEADDTFQPSKEPTYKGLAPSVIFIFVSGVAPLRLYLARADTVPHFVLIPPLPSQKTVAFIVNVSFWLTFVLSVGSCMLTLRVPKSVVL